MGKAVRKVSVFLLLAAVFCFAFFVNSAEAGVIMIENATGFDIYEVYISDSGTDDWEEDVLGENILEDEDMLRLTVNGSYKQFDLAAVDSDGTSVSWVELPGSASQIIIYADGTAEYK